MKLEQAVNSLPPAARIEVFDFIAFLKQKYRRKKSPVVKEDSAYWAALGETLFTMNYSKGDIILLPYPFFKWLK